MNIKNQIIKDNYSIYNADCMEVLPSLPDKSIDLSIYSPPFSGLYKYSSDPRDMSNTCNLEEFLTQYEFFVKELSRVIKDGRICAVHCMDLLNHDMSRLLDFPHELIKIHEKYGFKYRNRITIWKEPLLVRLTTMVQSLMHKFIVEDSTKCFTAMPDYVLIFVKNGENQVPVTHPCGIQEYYGEVPILNCMLQAYNNQNKTNFNSDQLWKHLQDTKEEEKVTKINHYIWQRYASAIWDDIRVKNVMPFKGGKEEDDEKHITPLQLDVIARLIELYSNKNEIILDPFNGVGSTTFQAIKMGRKAIGVELKESYFKQAKINLENVPTQQEEFKQEGLF